MNVLYNEVNDSICHCSGKHSHNINSSNIKDAINKLKRGKNDGLTSDYIINGTPLWFHYLSILFSLMLSHCYAPSSFCISTMGSNPLKEQWINGRNYELQGHSIKQSTV